MSVHNQSTHICINKIYEHKETIMFEIKKISKSFGRKKVLSSVSFNVEPGSCVGLHKRIREVHASQYSGRMYKG